MQDIMQVAESIDDNRDARTLARIASEARKHGMLTWIEDGMVYIWNSCDTSEHLVTSSAVSLAEWLGY